MRSNPIYLLHLQSRIALSTVAALSIQPIGVIPAAANMSARDKNNPQPVTDVKYAVSIFYGGVITGANLYEVPKNAAAHFKPPADVIDPGTDYVDLRAEERAYFDTPSIDRPILLFNMQAEVIQGTSVGLFGETVAFTAPSNAGKTTVTNRPGPVVLGATLHHVLHRINARKELGKANIFADEQHPVSVPIVVQLYERGLQLRFDGPEQRLRMIEVTDFTKARYTYDGKDILKQERPKSQNGPTFKSVYKQFGPATPGEFVESKERDKKYDWFSLSYPGIAFKFPVQAGTWKDGLNIDWAAAVNFLDTSAVGPACSMCIFHGESWPKVRGQIFTVDMPFPRRPILGATRADYAKLVKEVELARFHGEGRIELVRKNARSFWITLSETTPQDLITIIGPPDEIYRKPKPASAHRPRTESHSRSRRSSAKHDFAPGSWGSAHGPSSAAETDDEEEIIEEVENDDGSLDEEFWNYYDHGFDILISPHPRPVSAGSPTAPREQPILGSTAHSDANTGEKRDKRSFTIPGWNPVATKFLVHGNIPFSHAFNRHRRLRWEICHTPSPDGVYRDPLTSEMNWLDINNRLKEVYRGTYKDDEEEKSLQQPMAINRGWGGASTSDSMGGSGELLGGFEGDEDDQMIKRKNSSGKGKGKAKEGSNADATGVISDAGQAQFFGGYPGMIFEVLRNGTVCQVQIY